MGKKQISRGLRKRIRREKAALRQQGFSGDAYHEALTKQLKELQAPAALPAAAKH